MTDFPIVWTRWGLASCFDTHIELNEELKKSEWKPLFDWALLHERKHAKNKEYYKEKIGMALLNDTLLDLWDKNTPFLLLLKFLVMNPKSLTHLFPWQIDHENKILFVNYAQGIIWLLLFGIIGFVGKKYGGIA